MSRWVWAAGLLFCGGLGVGLQRLRAPSAPPAAPAPPAPSVLTAEACGALEARYAALAEPLRSCNQDDECVAEPRGGQFFGLDGCVRFRRRDAALDALAPVEAEWMQGACVTSYVPSCLPRLAQCRGGRCVERPAEPIPRDWQRIDVQKIFSFFAPPDLVDEHAHGDDSLVGVYRGALGELSFDYGAFANPLEGEGMPGGWPEAHAKTRAQSVVISGANARLVTYRGPKEVHAGVFFPHVPKPSAPQLWSDGESTRLELDLSCTSDCEATFLMIARSLEFY